MSIVARVLSWALLSVISISARNALDCHGIHYPNTRECIAVFPILADAVDVKRGDQLCETVSQPSIQPDKVVRPMGS